VAAVVKPVAEATRLEIDAELQQKDFGRLRMHTMQSRRDFLASATLAAATGLSWAGTSLADEGPPETTTIRLARSNAICIAPGYIAEDLLRAEGFTNVQYVESPSATVMNGEVDFDFETSPWLASHVDAGEPITGLAGVHSGCYELFVHEPIRTIGDLRGRRVGIPQQLGSSGHLLLASIAAYVGLDPQKDINWITNPTGDFMDPFAGGQVDAFLAFPPEPQELRARKIGRVILNIATDKPWSQYFCCVVYGNRAFVRDRPIATKRFLRALLKAVDICASEPERATQLLVDRGFTKRFDYALQALTEVPYNRWREFDPEDSMRFYALRLHEVGMLKSSPNALIAEGTDWRFLNELKRELKA
jgi:NitT/TauT family transport system substrate-binding protein